MTKFKNLKQGSVLSESQFYKVVKVSGNKVQLETDNGENVVVDDKYVESCLTSAEEVVSQKVINRTEAANLLISNPNVAMTVNFNKQVKESDVLKEVMTQVGSASIKDIEKAVKNGLKKAIQGEERTIVGRHHGEVTDMGRVQFVDMNIEKPKGGFDARMRQVDTRNINWIVLRGTKYTVK